MNINTISWLSWIVVGCLSGWAANIIVNSRRGLLTNMIIGVSGALIGGSCFTLFGASGFHLSSLLVAILVVALFLSVGRLWVGRDRAAY